MKQIDLLNEMYKDIKHIKEELIPSMRIELKALEVKNSIWSSVTGLVGGVLAILTMKIWK